MFDTQEKIPFSESLEQTILGSMFTLDLYSIVAEIVTEDDFYFESHRVFVRTIRGMVARGVVIDMAMVIDELKRLNVYESLGGDNRVMEFLKGLYASSEKNLIQYCERLKELSIERKMLEAAKKITHMILHKDGELTTRAMIETAEREILQVSNISGLGANEMQSKDSKDAIQTVINAIETARSRKDGELSGIRTGLKELDEYTDGFQKGDLIFIGARPSMGKTTLGLNFAESAFLTQKLPVVIFSMESPTVQITQRLIAAHSNVALGNIVRGEFDPYQFEKVSNTIATLKDSNFIISDKGSLSPSDMRQLLRRIAREHGGIGMVLADYVQLMKLHDNNKKTRNDELSEISRDLKNIAKEFNCPFLCLAQLSKDCERRPDKRPMMSDLRDCGGLEQDADMIIMIYRNEVYYPNDDESKGMADLLIRKNRNGRTGFIKTKFSGATFRFSNLDNYYSEGF